MRIYKFIYFLSIILVLFALPLSSSGQFSSKYFLTSDGVQLHYLEAGSGPLLILVPGWTIPANIWKPQIEYFSKTHQVVALDPRGQGRSEKPPHGYHSARRAEDIKDLITHLGNKPFYLAGWSSSGRDILIYAHEFKSSALQAVIVVDWDVKLENPMAFTSRFKSLQLNREGWTKEFIRAILQETHSEEYIQTVIQGALSMPTNAAAIMIANIILFEPSDLSFILDSLKIPVQGIFCGADWAINAAHEVRKNWPDIRVDVIPDTKHTLFVDNPTEFNRVMEEFINSIN